MSRRLRSAGGDGGSALIEFTFLAVLLLLPLVYVLLTVFDVQRSAFAVSQAAREAGRAYATADSDSTALARARFAADLALGDQGLVGPAEVALEPQNPSCPTGSAEPSLAPCTRFYVVVTAHRALPFAGRGMLAGVAPTITVHGRFLVDVDRFRSSPSAEGPTP